MSQQDNELIGVILAAGRGTRMEPFSESYPKPLLPIGNKPLIVHQILIMKELGIKKVIIVVGHLGHQISLVLHDGSEFGVLLQYVEQKELLGIAHAVGQLEKYISGSFVLFLGDIFFLTNSKLRAMASMIYQGKAHAVLAVKKENDIAAIRRNFTVQLRRDGRVQRVIEKPLQPVNNLKGCGLYVFDPYIFDAISRTPRTARRNEYELTDSIQILIDQGHAVYTLDAVDFDMNMTIPADVLECNLKYLQANNLVKCTGEDVSEDNGGRTKIINSVIGKKVILEGPTMVRDSVIFPGTRVTHTGEINRMIFTPEHTIDCRFNV